MDITEEFEGVFRFTNATDEDFSVLWNNKEYTFPKGTCCPMILSNETLENIQEIRKKFAYKLAIREFYKGKEYRKLVKLGESTPSGMPPLFDEKILQPWIDQCLAPLPKAQAKVKEGKKDSEKNYKASRSISEKDNPNFVFKDEVIQEKGAMPDTTPAFLK